jgi:hypothetical protein
MTQYVVHESAAAQPIGTNIMQGHRAEQRTLPRLLRWIAVVGSAAAGDCSIDIWTGDKYHGTYFNTATGTSYQRNRDQQDVNLLIMPGTPLRLEISDVSLTNAVNVFLDMLG